MILEDKVTKKVDLENNDGLSSFMGLAAQQTHNVYQVFYDFLKYVRPKRILEIGTALGGFTQFLKVVSDENELNIDILSYDIHEMNWYKDIISKGIDVRVENVFDVEWKSVKQDVIDFIQQDGVTIVLCDGGNKIGEFNILSNYIKQGDFIMAHDYGENKEVFEDKIKGKIWNWLEIQDGDIKDSCESNNLESYDKDVFDNVVWVCKIKK
jgi:23S rRNA U2552 (ribose-2'-O)-methylase RlmE/FtsJ